MTGYRNVTSITETVKQIRQRHRFELVRYFIELADLGLTRSQAAKVAGMSYKRFCGTAYQFGVKFEPSRGGQVTDRQVVDAMRVCKYQKDAAKMLGVSDQTISRRIRRARGIETKIWYLNVDENRDLRTLQYNGHTFSQAMTAIFRPDLSV